MSNILLSFSLALRGIRAPRPWPHLSSEACSVRPRHNLFVRQLSGHTAVHVPIDRLLADIHGCEREAGLLRKGLTTSTPSTT